MDAVLWCAPSGTGGDTPVLVNGVAVTIPDNQFVAPELRGHVLQAPTPGLAAGLAAVATVCRLSIPK